MCNEARCERVVGVAASPELMWVVISLWQYGSFRTSHYPYDEAVYDMADREGFLIIDETPAVGLLFYDGEENVEARQKQCRRAVNEMLTRDKNHPSVIMWSVANEPAHKGVGGANYDGKEKQGESEENRLAIQNLGE